MSRDIAIVGFAGKFPEAKNTDQFYQNLVQGRDSVRPITQKRMQDTSIPVKDNYKDIGFIEDIDLFDHKFFNLSMAEAKNMPPHHRLLLEVVYNTFENAAYDLEKIRGKKGAVFIGNAMINYIDLAESYDPTLLTGNLNSAIAGKIARFFDLRGGALMVDTACSSSLVALHYACNEINSGDAEFALACGMDLAVFLPTKSHHDIGVNAPDGKAKSFSAQANGTGMGEAVACVMLKPLHKAIEDQDIIHCVIKGSALNQDAALSASATAPDSQAQAQVINDAWKKAGIDPETITFIEAHGTGTEIGDPIEIKGLNLAFGKYTKNKRFCAVASLKSNMGHAGSAAGIAGMIKMILSYKHRMIFPSLHCETTNPLIDFENSAVFVNTQLRYWEGDKTGCRRSGVSSFGISGTNCHVVLEEPPSLEEPSGDVPEKQTETLIPISAKSRRSLLENIKVLKEYLSGEPKASFNAISNTLMVGRSHYQYRLCLLASDKKGLLESLSGTDIDAKISEVRQLSDKLIFTFSDDLRVSKTMLERFCDQYPAFKEAYSSIESFLETDNPDFRQFAFQYSFYHLLLRHHIESSRSIGDGVGKITSSYIREELSPEQVVESLRNFVRKPAENLKERLERLVANETSGEAVTFIEMGPEGSISAQLKALEITGSGFTTIVMEDGENKSFSEFIRQLYLAGYPLDWEPFLSGNGRRAELPLYQFDSIRCWLREPSIVPQSKVEEWLYQTNWQPDMKDRDWSPGRDHIFLVATDQQGLGQLVAEKLEQQENTCILLSHNEEFLKVSDLEYKINFRNESDFLRLAKDLFDNGIDVSGIIHLGEFADYQEVSIENVDEQLSIGLYSKIHLAKVFAERLTAKNFRLVFVTSHAENIQPEEETTVAVRSMSSAFIKSLLAEYPRLKINSIDLGGNGTKTATQADQVIAELWRDEMIPFVAYRGIQRYLPHLTNLEFDEKAAGGFEFDQENGVYLLTGGARGIGMAISQSIAQYVAKPTLILLGRTVIPGRELWEEASEEKIGKGALEIVNNIQSLESQGAIVSYHSVNVGDLQAMQALLQQVSKQYTEIDGMVHLAGIAGQLMPFEHKTLSDISEVLSPKVHGTLAMKLWADKLKPRFVALFSSLNALVPHKFTVGYTMANAFLDGFARSVSSSETHYLSISWPGWKQVGMSAGQNSGPEADQILKSIKTEDGVKAFYLALKTGRSSLAVADADLSYFLSNPFFVIDQERNEVPEVPVMAEAKPLPEVADPAATETEMKVLSFWYEILEADKIELDDDFFEAGGHSLNGTQLLNRIEKEFGVEVEFEDVFEFPTVRLLSQHIDSMTGEESSEHDIEYEGIKVQPASEYYAVTHSQRRLWIIDQMEEHQVAYNMTGAYQLTDIDERVLQKALLSLIQRHEILRTVFVLVDGELRQNVKDVEAFDFSIKSIDLQSDPDKFAKAKAIANQDAGTYFDLEKGPLLRMSLLKLTARDYVLLFNMHHIISDAWSMDVLKDDLIAFYESELSGGQKPLAPLRIQYKDYAIWQNGELDSEESKKHEAYWLSKFAGEISYLNLPTDLPRTQNKSFSGDNCGFLFSKSTGEQLAKLAKENGVSMFMLISATVYTLLYRYTQQTDITIGTPIANRNHQDLENQIGFYVNTLALRLQFDRDDSFLNILEKVKRNTLEAYEHQIFPFDKLVDLLDLDRDMSRNPLFDVNLVYQTAANAGYFEGRETGLLDSFNDSFSADPRTSIFDVTLDFTWDGSYLLLIAKYNTDIFFKSTIERLLRNFNILIASICKTPEGKIRNLDLLVPEEKTELLAEIKDSEISVDPVTDLLAIQVENNREKIAFTFKDRSFTYDELDRESTRLASFLTAHGIGKGSLVALLIGHSEYSLTTIYGVLKSGAAYLPLDPESHTDRLKFIIEDSAAKLVIFESPYVSKANQLLWEVESLEDYLCIDYDDVRSLAETSNQLMNQELWDYVGETAHDRIEAGGWVSSFTGLPFSAAEMDEYSENTYQKLLPHLHKDSRVLEIGCASGITMRRVAPETGYYLATDMSLPVLEFARKEAQADGLEDVGFKHLPAHEIHLLEEDGFDVVIINSVIQSFPGINYLQDVIGKCLNLMSEKGVLFLGDLQDLDKKDTLISDLIAATEKQANRPHQIKTDWSNELFLSRKFLEDLVFEFPVLTSVHHSDKTGNIRNELTDYRFDCVLIKDVHQESKNGGSRHKNCFDRSDLNSVALKSASQEPVIDLQSTAYIIYTSGTTGEPKGVELTHENLAHYVLHANAFYYQDKAAYCTALFTPFFFDLTVTSIFCPLLRGDQTVICDQDDITQTLSDIFSPGSSAKTVKLTPSHIMVLADLDLQETNVSLVISGGEALLPHHAEILFDLNPEIRIFNEYGPTETTVGVTVKEVGAADNQINIGKAVWGHHVYILDDNRELLPKGVAGELYIAGKGVAKGYLNRPELTRKKFLQNPYVEIDGSERLYRTGDLVKWTDTGELELLGRTDHQVKIRGYRVEIEAVEKALLSADLVDEAAVVVRQDSEKNQYLAGYFASASPIDTKDLRKSLSQVLPHYMVPDELIRIEEFKLNRNGKIDRKYLAGYVTDSTDGQDTSYFSEVESKLHKIWQELLERTRIGLNDDFFEIGGHSLKATRMIAHIFKIFQVKIDLRNVFANPTIKQLAELINNSDLVSRNKIDIQKEMPHYDITNAQKRIWLMSQADPDLNAYNMPASYLMEGNLNFNAFENALKSLTERHEILRTSLITVEGQPRQKIHDFEEIRDDLLTLEDIRNKSGDVEALARSMSLEISVKLIPLEKAPLFRASFIRIRDDLQLFTFSIHHIIADGWSMGLIINEMTQLYNAYVKEEINPLVPLRIQYKDYTYWLKDQLSGDNLSKLKNFWRQQLSGEIPQLQFPSVSGRPAEKTYTGDRGTVRLEGELFEFLCRFSRNNKLTMYMTLLASVKFLIYRYTGQRDIIVGTPVSGRPQVELEQQVGLYLNTVPLRTKLEDNKKLGLLLQEFRQNIIDSFEHQLYPFDNMIEDLGMVWDRSRNVLFDVGFNFSNEGNLVGEMFDGLRVMRIDSGFRSVKTDLWFNIEEQLDGLSVALDYNKDIFSGSFIEEFLRNLTIVLKNLSEEITLGQLMKTVKENEDSEKKEKQSQVRKKNLSALKNLK